MFDWHGRLFRILLLPLLEYLHDVFTFRREDVSGDDSTESNSASQIDYLDLMKRLPRTVLEECIVELVSSKKT